MRLSATLLFLGILVVIVPESPQAFQWRNRPAKQGFLWRAPKDSATVAVETSKEPGKTDSASSKESSKLPVTGEPGSKLPVTGEPGSKPPLTGEPGSKPPLTGNLLGFSYFNPLTGEPGTTGMPGTRPTGTVGKSGPPGTGTVVSHAPVTTDLICSTGEESAGTSRATASSPVMIKTKH